MNLKKAVASGDFTYYASIICVTLLALYSHWLPPFMIALVIFRYLESRKGQAARSVLNLKSTHLLLLFIILLIWQIFGLIQTDSLSSGIERIYKRASFILFPLALFNPSIKIKENLRFLLKLFAICLFVYFLFCLAIALNNSLTMVDGKLKFNPYHELYTYESYFTGLRLAVGAHPSYIAMYALLALLISIDNIFEKQKQSWLIFWVIASIAFIVFIVLLSSRSGVIAAIITLPLFILYRLRGSIQTWLLLGILVVSISGVSIMALNNARVKTSLKDVSENKINEVLNEDIRVTIWKSAWEVIKVNPVMGVGTGNASTELKKEFLKKGYTEGLYDSLNAHNQFLEIQLENGIIGLVIFLLLLGYGLYIAVSENNYFLLAYIIMTIIFFIFESMLNRLAGVMFFPFFMFLLINYEDPGKKDEVKIQRGA